MQALATHLVPPPGRRSPHDVLAVRDWLQVVGVYARAVTTQVIYVVPLGDRTHQFHPCHTMGILHVVVVGRVFELAIPVPQAGRPLPTVA